MSTSSIHERRRPAVPGGAMGTRTGRLVVAVAVAGLATACGQAGAGDSPTSTTAAPATASNTTATPTTSATEDMSAAASDPATQQYPDVLEVEATATGATWTIAATISSPYDTPERYADAFRVLAPDGAVLGVRELAHDHASEQPFTRSLADVAIPDDVTTITVEGRDLANGWGGTTVTIDLPG